ncbi:MAG: KxYKxGKxW signal peptide domain-containing protein, partial [Ligilactobacillus agilis]|nr:KxYKxGKxW signal peptide domain-containing protein [Ligilactobacillus agilis]
MKKLELKKRYKMYKAGKAWVVAPVVFLGLVAGLSANIKAVAADTVSQAQTT